MNQETETGWECVGVGTVCLILSTAAVVAAIVYIAGQAVGWWP